MSRFDVFRDIMNSYGSTNGQLRKAQSDQTIDITWDEDIQSKKCYIYDYFHDDEKHKLKGYDPSKSTTKTAIDAKFIITQYNTISKDQVEYHLQFRPSQEKCPLDYYKNEYEVKYWAEYPMGLYVDIPDDKNVYRKWLIVSSEYANQFVKYSILPCNYYFAWVMDNVLYGMCGVARLRNSYNSGVWTDYKFTTVENQDQIWLPINKITENLNYTDEETDVNQRIIVSAPIKHPNAWYVSKLETLHPMGVYKVTLSQTKFNPVTDALVKMPQDESIPEEEKFMCWIADYNRSPIVPEQKVPETHTGDYCVLDCASGINQIKVKGGFKRITATFYNEDVVLDTYTVEEDGWSFTIDGEDASELVSAIYPENNCIKIKFLGDESYYNKVLVVSAIDSTVSITASTEVAIVSL